MPEPKKNIHKDHRKRVKDRFRREGLDHFAEVHVLELLLFFALPQGDTNPLAHTLLDRFGSLTGVLDAPAEELEKVPGVGEHVSTLLNLTREISRYYMVNDERVCRILNTIKLCGDFLVPYFVGRRDETVFVLCLDSKCKVICCKELGSGSVNATAISIRKVVEAALGANAASVVLAHNHPSGFAMPSDEDVLTTRRIGCALDVVGITLADHIVVADGDFVSMVQSGLYRPEDCRMVL
ncbi:MAG: DNA repair protein RadC [Oscillospiraceae bacterium]|nr:DNA repair protein RadC [Oscillospiraceae bacterium]